jgi:predicted MFS family arabinose efflux permease
VLLYRNFFSSGQDDDGIGGLAVVVGAAGVGVVAAAWLTPIVTSRIGKERWIVRLLVSGAVIEIALVTPFSQPLFVLAAFLLGLVAQGVKICVDTIVQQNIEDSFRGRVFSLYDVVFNVSFVAAAGVGVALLPMSGKSYLSVVLIAAGYLAAGLGYRASLRSLQRRETMRSPVAPQPVSS